jgi:hypothetical protein
LLVSFGVEECRSGGVEWRCWLLSIATAAHTSQAWVSSLVSGGMTVGCFRVWMAR